MVNCPKCGKAVAGRAMVCGYCGESLVRNYFGRKVPLERAPARSAGTLAATYIGTLGALALLVALGFCVAELFKGILPPMDLMWCVRMLLLALLPGIYLSQQLTMRGERFSLGFDGVWLFGAVCALCFLLQGWVVYGAAAMDGSMAAVYLAAGGCVLVIVSSLTAMVTYRENGQIFHQK